MGRKTQVRKLIKKSQPYDSFDQINGEHPLKDVIPDSYVPYNVRYRPGGKVVYFKHI